jgi:hypothetical protein
MAILRVIIDLFNLLTGRTLRHNRALRNLRDWVATVREFLSEYRLGIDSNIGFLLENARQADFDLVALAHKGNLLVKPATRIRGKQVAPRLAEIVNEMENMRRALMSPALRSARLPEVLSRLRLSFEKLQEKLSAVEYL